MARLGMDVDLVESASRDLKSRAMELNRVVQDIDRIVSNLLTIWDGPDASRFVNEWWPEHKRELIEAGSEIEGLGQSAWNNASEQRQVSGR
jgi:uncharacterized protein YukE